MRKYSKNYKRRAQTEEAIFVAMENKFEFGDQIIIQYLGYQGSPEVPMVKIRCKCGHEKIVRWAQLKSRSCRARFICEGKENEIQPSDEAKVLKSHEKLPQVYKAKYYDKWLAMNRACDPKIVMNPRSKYHEKGIQVCPEWRRYRNYPHSMTQENYNAYKNYETFIDSLLEKHGYTTQDLFNGTIRVSRIDVDEDFEPDNIGLQLVRKGVILS